MSKEEMLRIVSDAISNLEKKDFNVYFFVLDTKGNPSSKLEYIYQTALTLKNDGYNVAMLHQEKDFVGVADWLGKEYAEIPHYNVETDNVSISVSDFLFIPEVFTNVMMQTKKLPCKRVLLVQNYKHLTEFMPVSHNMETLSISDAIVTTEDQEAILQSYFPTLKTSVVHPAINTKFKTSEEPQKMLVNVVCQDQSKVHQVVKPFYWKYETYKWVSFRDLRSVTQDLFAESLREAAITVWIDDDTVFGYSLLDALRSGGVVLAKVPNKPAEWMLNENGDLTESILWFDDIDKLPDMLAQVVRSWALDAIPDEVYVNELKFNEMFTPEQQSEDITNVYINGIFKKRLIDFKEVLSDVENNKFNGNLE